MAAEAEAMEAVMVETTAAVVVVTMVVVVMAVEEMVEGHRRRHICRSTRQPPIELRFTALPRDGNAWRAHQIS